MGVVSSLLKKWENNFPRISDSEKNFNAFVIPTNAVDYGLTPFWARILAFVSDIVQILDFNPLIPLFSSQPRPRAVNLYCSFSRNT